MAPRQLLLGLALAATLAAALLDWPAPELSAPARAGAAPAVSDPAAPGAAPAPPAAAAPESPPALREPYAASAADAFAPKRWLPPPPPPAPPEKPKAPPLPFKYLGKALVDGEAVAFLGQGPRTHLLRSGDILAGYKVESVSATEIALVYLPLNETQRLTFGSDH